MKFIYMKETFDILDSETVQEIAKKGKIKQTKTGTKYLMIEETEEILEK